MGSWQLTDFRSELEEALGNPGLGTTRQDRFINAGYDELVGAVEFKRFITTSAITTVDGTVTYSEPSDLLGVKGVVDTENDKRLLRMTVESFLMLDEDEEGKPTRWTRRGGNIHLWPTPDDAYDLTLLYLQQPSHLSADADTTLIPNEWDVPIWMFSVHYALTSAEEQAKAAWWFNRAVAYIRSRDTDREKDARSEATPLWIAQDFSDLETRRG